MGMFDDLKQSRAEYAEQQKQAKQAHHEREGKEHAAYAKYDYMVTSTLGSLADGLEVLSPDIETTPTGWALRGGQLRPIVTVTLHFSDDGEPVGFAIATPSATDEPRLIEMSTATVSQEALADGLRVAFADPARRWW